MSSDFCVQCDNELSVYCAKCVYDLRKALERAERERLRRTPIVVTTGGTYIGSVDFAAALRQLEIERDEANAEIVQYKEERLRLRAEVSRLKRKIENAPCLAARDGEMTYECRVDNLCRVCRWRSESLEE